MDKKTMIKIFGGAFLRSMIVLMAVAILGFGVFFIAKVGKDKKDLANREEGPTTEYSDDELAAMIAEDNAANSGGAVEDTEAVSTEEVTTEAVTTEAATEAPNIASTDKNILVINSTSVNGLAGTWATKLKNSGFANVGTANRAGAQGQESVTKIYVSEEGMGKDLAALFSGDAQVIVQTLDASSYSVVGGGMDHYDIFIVIGTSDTSVQ